MKKRFHSFARFATAVEFSLLALLRSISSHAQGLDSAGQYPFPQNRIYSYGIMPASRNHLDAQESYNSWKANYVTTAGACGFRRVLFNDMNSTYSEGIGYGMLLAANFDDQALFDDLWGYYNAHLDGNGLMNWWIGGTCGQVLGSTAATDADEDVAFALLLADKQWGSAGTINYLQRAITQINRIYQREVERNTYVLKPGDAWGGSSVTNPSYFAPAYYRVFRAVTGNAGWDSVAAKCYTILQRCANGNTGLVPDWCQASGAPAPGYAYYYYYDATRTPWRIALDYLWFGQQQARTFSENITRFARGVGSINVREGYYLEGTPIGAAHINVFVGPFGAGSMGTNPSNQAFCDSAYQDNVATVPPSAGGNYYNWSLRTLTLFLQTGNFFNPLEGPNAAPAPPALMFPSNLSSGNNPSLMFRWHASPTATSYRMQVATDSLFTTLVVHDSLITDTTRQSQNLQPLTWYYWRVSAKNQAGTGPFSPRWSFRTIGTPTQVALVAPPNRATNQPLTVTFRWRQGSDQTNEDAATIRGYWFELTADTTAQPAVRDTSLVDTLKTVGSLANETIYYWRVRAKNEVGWGEFGAWWMFTTVVAAPGLPQLVAPGNGSTGNALSGFLQWRPLAAAERYRVLVATDTMFSSVVVNDSTVMDTTRPVSGLQSGTWYFWKVSAQNAGGTSPWSARWTFRTLLPPPDPVALVAPPHNALIGTDSVAMVWRRSRPEVDRYWLELATDSLFAASQVDSNLVDTIKIVRHLLARDYWWRVRGANEAGWGVFREVRHFRVTTTGSDAQGPLPVEFFLAQNYPNPFNPSTKIAFSIPVGTGHVPSLLKVYDVLGREVRTLVNDNLQPGNYEVTFDASGLVSGTYFYRLQAGQFVQTKKLLLMR